MAVCVYCVKLKSSYINTQTVGQDKKNDLKRIGKSNILSGQFEQHWIVEKFVDGYVLAESFTPTSLDHKFTSKMSGWLWLQWSQDDALVQWISRYNLPMVEHG